MAERTVREVSIRVDGLSADVSTIKGDVAAIKADLGVIRGDVNRIDRGLDEIRGDLRAFRVEFTGLEKRLERFEKRFDALIGNVKWVVGLLAVFLITSIGGWIWWASKTDTELRTLATRSDAMEKDQRGIRDQLNRIEAAVRK